MGGMASPAIEDIIRILEDVAQDPERCRDAIPIGQEQTYFAGVGFALRLFLRFADGGRLERQLRHAAAESLGFDSSRHPVEQMLNRGQSPDFVLSELARLEIAFIRLAFSGNHPAPESGG